MLKVAKTLVITAIIMVMVGGLIVSGCGSSGSDVDTDKVFEENQNKSGAPKPPGKATPIAPGSVGAPK